MHLICKTDDGHVDVVAIELMKLYYDTNLEELLLSDQKMCLKKLDQLNVKLFGVNPHSSNRVDI